jgi:PAS domain S-box-containing protein
MFIKKEWINKEVIGRVRKHVQGILIASIGLIITVPYLIRSAFGFYTFGDFCRHMLLENRHHHLLMLLTIVTFGIIGYLFEQHRNSRRELEQISQSREIVKRRILEAEETSSDLAGMADDVADVIRRKKVEERISILSNALDRAVDGLLMFDLEGKVLFMNQAGLRMTGHNLVDEVKGKNIADFYADKGMNKSKSDIELAMKKGRWIGEIPFKKKDNSTFLSYHNTSKILDEKRKPIAILSIFRDITDQNKAEKELKIFSKGIEDAAEGVILLDLKGNFLRINKAGEKASGYAQSELIRKNLAILTSSSGEAEKIIQTATKDGLWNGELKGKSKDGGTYEIPLSLSVVKDEKNAPTALFGIFRSITSEEKATEDKFRNLVQSLPDMVYEADTDMKLTYANEEAFRILGYSPQDIEEGLSMKAIIDESEIPILDENFVKLMKGEDPEPKVYTMKKKNGTIFRGEMHSKAIYEDDKPIRLAGVIKEVTETKIPDNEIQTLAEAFDEIQELIEAVSNSSDSIIISDRYENIKFWNRGAESMFGYTEDEALGKKINTIIPDTLMQEVSMQESLKDYESECLTRGGKRIPVSITLNVIEFDGKLNGYVGVLRDISHRKGSESGLIEPGEEVIGQDEDIEFEVDFQNVANGARSHKVIIEEDTEQHIESQNQEPTETFTKETEEYGEPSPEVIPKEESTFYRHLEKGWDWFRGQEYQRALEEWQKAYELKPDNKSIRFNISRLQKLIEKRI